MTSPPRTQPMTATATPWKVTRDERGSIVRATGEDGQPIASMWLNGNDPEANAAFIVDAVNNHELLKARIRELEVEISVLEPKAAAYDACRAKIDCLSRTGTEPQSDWNYTPKPGQLGGPSTKD